MALAARDDPLGERVQGGGATSQAPPLVRKEGLGSLARLPRRRHPRRLLCRTEERDEGPLPSFGVHGATGVGLAQLYSLSASNVITLLLSLPCSFPPSLSPASLSHLYLCPSLTFSLRLSLYLSNVLSMSLSLVLTFSSSFSLCFPFSFCSQLPTLELNLKKNCVTPK